MRHNTLLHTFTSCSAAQACHLDVTALDKVSQCAAKACSASLGGHLLPHLDVAQACVWLCMCVYRGTAATASSNSNERVIGRYCCVSEWSAPLYCPQHTAATLLQLIGPHLKAHQPLLPLTLYAYEQQPLVLTLWDLRSQVESTLSLQWLRYREKCHAGK